MAGKEWVWNSKKMLYLYWILTAVVWVGELELVGQEGAESVAEGSQMDDGTLLNSLQFLWTSCPYADRAKPSLLKTSKKKMK